MRKQNSHHMVLWLMFVAVACVVVYLALTPEAPEQLILLCAVGFIIVAGWIYRNRNHKMRTLTEELAEKTPLDPDYAFKLLKSYEHNPSWWEMVARKVERDLYYSEFVMGFCPLIVRMSIKHGFRVYESRFLSGARTSMISEFELLATTIKTGMDVPDLRVTTLLKRLEACLSTVTGVASSANVIKELLIMEGVLSRLNPSERLKALSDWPDIRVKEGVAWDGHWKRLWKDLREKYLTVPV